MAIFTFQTSCSNSTKYKITSKNPGLILHFKCMIIQNSGIKNWLIIIIREYFGDPKKIDE